MSYAIRTALQQATWPWFFLLLGFTVWNYRLGLWDLPSRDQLMFVDEKLFFPNNWDFFLHSLEFSRGRLLGVGDYFLFRPGHFTLLGLNLILTEEHLQWAGLFTYPLVAFTALSLFLVGRRLVSPGLALLTALLWIDLFPGVFTIVWRHINPYLLAIAFLALALAKLLEAQQRQTAFPFSASFYLFVASLFHEVVLFSLALLFLVTRVKASPDHPALLRTLELHKRTIAPALLANLFLNFLDLLWHPLPGLFGVDDSLHLEHMGETFLAVWVGLPGASGVSLLLPFLVEKFTLGNWPFMAAEGNRWLVLAVGTPLSLLLGFALVTSWRSLRQGSVNHRTLTLSLVLPFFWGIVLIWGSGRALSRGVGYLYENPHYYLMLDGLLLLVALALLPRQGQQTVAPGSHRLLWVVILLVLPFHHLQLQELLAENHPRSTTRAHSHLAFREALAPYTNSHCLIGKGYTPDSGEALLSVADSSDVTLLLRPHFCQQGDGREKSQLRFQQGSWWLAKVIQHELPAEFQWQEVGLPNTSSQRWHRDERGSYGDAPRLYRAASGSFLTHPQPLQGPSLAVTMLLPYRGGMVFGLEEDGNYDLLRIHEHRLLIFRYRQGKAVRAESFDNHLPPNALGPVRLEMLYQGEKVWLFVNGDFYTSLDDLPPVNGQVGLYSPKGGLGKQRYTSLQAGPPLPLTFIPVSWQPVSRLWQP
ncbi:MAG: hypothetical protein G8345_02915 [Magnetococcales bacterium]|nr:hypothetical protein [Magnetococcales bacterium]NGZ25824.1 hypothetical protein [Magnetococcales bacterium]